MRRSPTLLYVALAFFVASAILILVSLERGSRGLAVLGGIGNIIAGIIFLSLLLPRKNVDWERIEMEQRLWESGPLGRSWLRLRRRLYDRWKM